MSGDRLMTAINRMRCSVLLTAALASYSTACKQGNDDVLARLGSRDSITVAEFRFRLEKAAGDQAASLAYEQKKNFLLELTNLRLELLAACDAGLDKDTNFISSMEKAKEQIVLNAAWGKYIYSHFIDDAVVARYKKYYGREMRVQNLVIRFTDHPKTPSDRTRAQAVKIIDSVRAIMTAANFNSLCEKYSDYKSKQTKAGSVNVEKLKFGSLPMGYENEVIVLAPNSISKPIEFPGVFMIARLVAIENDGSQDNRMNSDQIKRLLKDKLDDSDRPALLRYHAAFIDSLFRAFNVKVVDANIDTLVTRFPGNQPAKSMLQFFSATQRELPLVTYGVNDRVTLQDAAGMFDAEMTLSKFKHQAFADNLKEYVKDVLMKKLMKDSGYRESIAFTVSVSQVRQDILVQQIEARKFMGTDTVSGAEVRQEYDTHPYRYRTAAASTAKEIYSLNPMTLRRALELIGSGTDFDKVVETLRADKIDDRSLVLKGPVKYSFSDQNEAARAAMRLVKDDVSGIIPRKDGGYSIVKVVSKTESVSMLFEGVRESAEKNYREELMRRKRSAWLRELRHTYPVVLFENNLNY